MGVGVGGKTIGGGGFPFVWYPPSNWIVCLFDWLLVVVLFLLCVPLIWCV